MELHLLLKTTFKGVAGLVEQVSKQSPQYTGDPEMHLFGGTCQMLKMYIEIAAVRHYLEYNSECRRYQLLSYFGEKLTNNRDRLLCFDTCAALACTSSENQDN